MVDMFSRYVILAPIKEKTARAVARAVVTNLICKHTANRVLLSDNGSEFSNKVLADVFTQFGITQTFTVAYHSASNWLVERTNRKILEILRPIVGRFIGTWEDLLPQVAATINASVSESTGQTIHFIVYGVQKRLPYDLLSAQQPPIYDVEEYAKIQLTTFSSIHKEVSQRLQHASDMRTAKQHQSACPVTFNVGDAVMVAAPERHSKLSPKFSRPHKITHATGGNRYIIFYEARNLSEVVHNGRLKATGAEAPSGVSPLGSPPSAASSSLPAPELPSVPSHPAFPTHAYNLRPRS